MFLCAATSTKMASATASQPLDEDLLERHLEKGLPVQTKYEFADVAIPANFLVTTPQDAQPLTARDIDWTASPLPEYDGSFAMVLDNVLSPSECDALVHLAEQSVPEPQRGRSGQRFWRPALVNVGDGYEVLVRDYRNSDRIIWDQQEVVDRLCAGAVPRRAWPRG